MRKRNFKHLPFCISVLLSLAVSFLHAQQPAFNAQVSEKRVVQNGVFDIQFVLSDAQGSNFVPPSFSDFRVVGGPSRGSSTTIINGVMNSSETWSYSLLATKQGRFTIGSASVVVGRKKLTTNPVVIEVVKGRDLVQKSEESTEDVNVFLIAEVEKKDYYPGQQIVLNYRLLFRQDIQAIDVLSEDDYADFFVQNFSEYSKQPSMEKINGVDYTSRIIKSIGLFPHQSGVYEIDPMVMTIGINAPFSGIHGFFTMRRMQEVRIASDPIKIHVLPLPANAPTTFHGAVGEYSLKTISTQREITTDDALTFQLEIRGNGDPKRWDPPLPQVDSSFEQYDPKILEDVQVESNGQMENRRTLEYQMLPKTAGSFSLYVPFTYFNPDQKRYVTISSDTLKITVAQGVGKRSVVNADEPSLQQTLDIKPVRFAFFADRFWISWPHLLLFGMLVSGSCYGLWAQAKRRREGKIPLSEKIKSAAGRVANAALEQLQVSSASMESKAFYEQASGIYYRFLSERLLIPFSELDEHNLPGYLAKANIDQATADKAIELFRQFLPLRYGGLPPVRSREELIADCQYIIGTV